MYHEIAEGPNSLYVPAEQFAAHLEYLSGAGYSAITLQQLYDHFTHGLDLPERAVVLTFDDGYSSFYASAMPLLKQHGFTATVFVITDLVGQPGYLTWEQIQQLAAEGFEVGSHTVTHRELPGLNSDAVRAELIESGELLEAKTSLPVRFFCYPVGRHDDRTVSLVEEAGYLGAVTTIYGTATDSQSTLRWRRVRVSPVSATELARQLSALDTR